MSSPQQKKLFKIVLIGDSAVGKSSLITRYTTNQFKDSYKGTIGIDFMTKTLDGGLVTLQIWDTAGQERFGSVTKAFWRGSDGFLIVYAIDDKESFLNVQRWYDDLVKQTADSDKHAPVMLVGNKLDLESERMVTFQEGKEYADTMGFIFIETSCKTAANVEEAFSAMSDSLQHKDEKQVSETEITDQLILSSETPPKSSMCGC